MERVCIKQLQPFLLLKLGMVITQTQLGIVLPQLLASIGIAAVPGAGMW
jgi:Na+/H+-dicarboxylate symporter